MMKGLNNLEGRKIFGVDVREIERLCSKNPILFDKNSPIDESEYLEPCLRGAQKIMEDGRKRELLKQIYRSK